MKKKKTKKKAGTYVLVPDVYDRKEWYVTDKHGKLQATGIKEDATEAMKNLINDIYYTV